MSWFTPVERAFKKFVYGERVKMDYLADGLGVCNRNNSFLVDNSFDVAWNEVADFNAPYWNNETPDIRWRAHLVVWAAEQALRLEGDFAEFGVNTGIFSSMIYKLTPLSKTKKKFYLFDTYEGIPIEQSNINERATAEHFNKILYNHNSYEVAKQVFHRYENAILVKGMLPKSLNDVKLEKLCYVSIDMNITEPEISVIKEIWEILVPGAFVVLDDYNFGGHREQHVAWNDFAASKNRNIFQSPTGQGLLQK